VISMLTAIGIGLVVAGLVLAVYGDAKVSSGGGFISRLFRWPEGRAKWLKLGIGLALIYAGVMLLTQGN
jgi:threonine/homoserine/homoserine lactone efflux protein